MAFVFYVVNLPLKQIRFFSSIILFDGFVTYYVFLTTLAAERIFLDPLLSSFKILSVSKNNPAPIRPFIHLSQCIRVPLLLCFFHAFVIRTEHHSPRPWSRSNWPSNYSSTVFATPSLSGTPCIMPSQNDDPRVSRSVISISVQTFTLPPAQSVLAMQHSLSLASSFCFILHRFFYSLLPHQI